MLKVQERTIELLLEECLVLYSKHYIVTVLKKHLLGKFCHYLKKKTQTCISMQAGCLWCVLIRKLFKNFGVLDMTVYKTFFFFTAHLHLFTFFSLRADFFFP